MLKFVDEFDERLALLGHNESHVELSARSRLYFTGHREWLNDDGKSESFEARLKRRGHGS